MPEGMNKGFSDDMADAYSSPPSSEDRFHPGSQERSSRGKLVDPDAPKKYWPWKGFREYFDTRQEAMQQWAASLKKPASSGTPAVEEVN